MTTQYTPILKLALPVTGELTGAWGDVVNQNITSMVEQAVAGAATISTWTSNSHTLTTANGTTSESRCAALIATSTTAASNIICPNATKLYVVFNNSSFAVTLKTAAGTGVVVPVGKAMPLWCDGTNVVSQISSLASLTLATALAVADGGTGATTAAGAQTNLNVPSTTGTGASGSWNINAATATALQTARTINGVSFNGTANITLTAVSPNAVTFNNSGTGAASGTTYDGSTAVTLSYNTIGASPLAGSTSLTTLGTVGTGTWQGSIINSTYGGMGVNNGGRTLTLNTNSGTITYTLAGTTLTVANNASVSGTNTGDQTSVSGSAGSVVNAVTFNNGGAGAASGTTFNGSAAQTISYNTVGAPSTTGTNASGTWGISISGNANTATSATSATTATTATNQSGGSVNATTGAFSGILTANAAFRDKQNAIAAANLDLSLGNYFSKNIAATPTTFTVSNTASSGNVSSVILDLTNGGSATITWWTGVKWQSGAAPTLTAVGRDVLGFFTYDGGTTWTGLLLALDVK